LVTVKDVAYAFELTITLTVTYFTSTFSVLSQLTANYYCPTTVNKEHYKTNCKSAVELQECSSIRHTLSLFPGLSA